MMRRSVNEVVNEFRKAAIGAGYPVGLAEDLARAAGILAIKSDNCTEAFLEAVENGFVSEPYIVKKTGNETERNGIATNKVTGFDVATHASVFFEMLFATKDRADYAMAKSENLALLLAYAYRAADLYECGYEFEWGDGYCCKISSSNKTGFTNALTKLDAEPASRIKIRLCNIHDGKPGISVETETSVSGARVNEALWPKVKLLAAKTYVPTSEASRLKGAGAIINDSE